MTIVVDPQFSVYHLVQRVKSQSTLLNHRRTMSLVSYEIENATLMDDARTRVFSGFQYMSRFVPQIPRYRRLAEKAESIYVFGVPDVEVPEIPNIIYVPLKPTDQLAKEWFLISYGRDYFSALATEEKTNITDPDEVRLFNGVWTFEFALVNIMNEWLTSAVDARPLPFTETEVNYGRQVRLMSTTMARLTSRMAKYMLQQEALAGKDATAAPVSQDAPASQDASASQDAPASPAPQAASVRVQSEELKRAIEVSLAPALEKATNSQG